MWLAVLYGVYGSDDMIVQVALSQIGNVGGEPYWSWYGFGSRVEWCACFVSWCADQCGYIDTGICPKYAGCVNGVDWFKDHEQWAENSIEPSPGMIVFFDCIPFVDRNNQSTASVVGNSRNFRILLRHAFRGINHQNDHIRALNCCNRANNTVAFNIFLNFTLPPKSGCVNKNIFRAIVNNFRVNRISCCSGNIRNNNTIFT